MTGRIVIVTGTNTGVGKTIATAALAARALGHRERVAVVKPVQTGTTDDIPDAAVIRRLTGIDVHQYTALAEPLAPDTAARRAGVEIPPIAVHAARVRALARSHDLVLVEGAGGLLVRLDTNGGTVLDLADDLRGHPPGAPGAFVDPAISSVEVSFVVVVGAGLGTLNHTELTSAAIRTRGHAIDGIIIGSWPKDAGLAERCNLDDLPRVTDLPLLGTIPAGVSALTPPEFSKVAQRELRSLELAWIHRRARATPGQHEVQKPPKKTRDSQSTTAPLTSGLQ